MSTGSGRRASSSSPPSRPAGGVPARAAFLRARGRGARAPPRGESDLNPWSKTDDLLGGFYVPDEGRVNPVDLTMALARGARQRRPDRREAPRWPRLARRGGHVNGCVDDTGDIECEHVVNCAGMWARQLGAGAGVRPAAGRRALLPDHRQDRRARPTAGASRTRRRTATTAKKAAACWSACSSRAAPWLVDGDPGGLRLLGSRPTGTAWRRSWRRHRARAGVARRHPDLLLRAGELHARPRADARRGTRLLGYFAASGSTRSASSPAARGLAVR